MIIDIECEDQEDKEWLEKKLESILDEAIFDLGATVMINGAYVVIKGYNNPYHAPKQQAKEDAQQTKLRV